MGFRVSILRSHWPESVAYNTSANSIQQQQPVCCVASKEMKNHQRSDLSASTAEPGGSFFAPFATSEYNINIGRDDENVRQGPMIGDDDSIYSVVVHTCTHHAGDPMI